MKEETLQRLADVWLEAMQKAQAILDKEGLSGKAHPDVDLYIHRVPKAHMPEGSELVTGNGSAYYRYVGEGVTILSRNQQVKLVEEGTEEED